MAPSFVPGQRATSRARNLVPVRREPEDRWETRNEKVCGGVAAAGGCAAAGRFPFRRARRDDDIFQLPTGRHTGLFSLPTIVPVLSLSLSLEWKHTVAGADPAAGEICARATWKYFTARYIFRDGVEFFISSSFLRLVSLPLPSLPPSLLFACFPFAKLIVNESGVIRFFSSNRGKRETTSPWRIPRSRECREIYLPVPLVRKRQILLEKGSANRT